MKNLFRTVFILIILTITQNLQAQSELDLEISLFGGAEYNIYKSPDVLLNRTNMEPFPDDSIRFNDAFADGEYDIEFNRTGERSEFEIGSNMWYRKYMRYEKLDQGKFTAFTAYRYFLSEAFSIGGEYELTWSDQIGTSVTGDLLMRSFKYYSHTGQFYLDLQPSEKLQMRLFGDYEFKDYYDEMTRDPLDHANLEVNYEMDFEINNENGIQIEAAVTDRDYIEYHSLNAAGDYDIAHPLRQFRYYEGKFDYNWTPAFGFRINPNINFTRRIDLFEGYYSYTGAGGSLKLRYFNDKIYISLYGAYERVAYDIRPAFTSMTDDPMLVYGYYDLNLTFRYNLTEHLELNLELELDNRLSNTDLEYFKTRRPYHNHLAKIGVTFLLPVID
ncbi:MAG: hypothetical protein P1P82_15555 [Bacteroidales bacterium]|nr:hypothetical protein [Bacteroidales bacterium]MDT8430727.1 hypothetical protein [Bacteroidales bacterium]